MKRVIIFSIFIFYLFGCSDDSNPLSSREISNYRVIAFESLSEREKETIPNWREAAVIQGKYLFKDNFHVFYYNSENIIPFITNSPGVILKENQKLISVRFNTTEDALLGPIILIIEPVSEKVIGFVGRL